MVKADRMRSQLRRAMPAGFLLLGVLIGALLVIAFGSGDTTSTPSATSSSASNSSSSGMNMGTGATSGASAGGIKPVPMQQLGVADWQGMKITAQAMTAVPFVVYNGTSEQMVRPGRRTSFHLMVMLNDSHTGVTIPYAGVWATISQDGKVVYDERQWPMLSAFMGPHYGNNVSLPGAGEYQLSLLISPPVSARHMEYQNVWLKPHRVNVSFHWKPVT